MINDIECFKNMKRKVNSTGIIKLLQKHIKPQLRTLTSILVIVSLETHTNILD